VPTADALAVVRLARKVWSVPSIEDRETLAKTFGDAFGGLYLSVQGNVKQGALTDPPQTFG